MTEDTDPLGKVRTYSCHHCKRAFERVWLGGRAPMYCSKDCQEDVKRKRKLDRRAARGKSHIKTVGPRIGSDSAAKKRDEYLRAKGTYDTNPSRDPQLTEKPAPQESAPSKHYSRIGITYARQVVAGEIVANKEAKLACERHLRDLERQSAPGFPYHFEEEAADKVCREIERLPHIKGRWAAKKEPLRLEPWQCFAVTAAFGWKRDDNGLRKFREFYLRVARKNAKSTLAAAIGIVMMTRDGEHGAEVYSGATTEKQAWEVFGPARLMLEKSPKLCSEYGVEVWAKALIRPEDNSKFQPIIGDPGDGASPSCAIIDEYHEHITADQYATMKTGMGAREHPMLLIITTAGDDLGSPCKEKDDIARKVLEGTFEDEEMFVLIYGIDEGDDWTDPAVLLKANPNIGVSVDREFLIAQQKLAVQNPAEQNYFKTKHLNMWVGAAVGAINSEDWKRAADPTLKRSMFKGKRGAKGLDLASKIDIAADCDVFPKMVNGERHYYAFGKFYLPEDTIEETKVNKMAYTKWVATGHLIKTPGAEIDFSIIRDAVKADKSHHQIEEIRYDPWRATQLAQEMAADGAKVVEMPQNGQAMVQAFDEFLSALKGGRFHHDGNPVLEWMASNVIKKRGPKGTHFPGREEKKEHKKIDGIVAIVMAMATAMTMSVDDSAGLMAWLKNPVTA